MDGDGMTSGFYKVDGALLYAPGQVYNANYQLHAADHAAHTYPVDGWHWFNTLEDACDFFEIDMEEYLNALMGPV
jgi:hypothetical protein